MKKIFIICLCLTACNATGPVYNEADIKDNLVIYRPTGVIASARTYHISINGQQVCKLGNGGFFTTNINGQTELSADAPDMFGTSRITVTPPSYIRIEAKSGKFLAGGFAGLVGMGAAQITDDTPGPYKLTAVTPEQAKSELKGLNRDCYEGSN